MFRLQVIDTRTRLRDGQAMRIWLQDQFDHVRPPGSHLVDAFMPSLRLRCFAIIEIGNREQPDPMAEPYEETLMKRLFSIAIQTEALPNWPVLVADRARGFALDMCCQDRSRDVDTELMTWTIAPLTRDGLLLPL